MQFWYNVNPNSPWMNRCGLTSGKKSLVTAQKSNNDSKNFFKKIKESSRETSWTEEPSLRCFQDKPSKKKKKKYNPPPTPKQDWRCLSHRQSYLFLGLLLSLGPLFFRRSWGAPDTVLFHPKLGSDCSGAPSSLRLPTPPHNN